MTFTAIIYTYNPDEAQLKRTISFALQLFDEVILIDDCSDTYIPKFKGVRMYRNIEHVGLIASKTLGVERATGNAVAFLKDNSALEHLDIDAAREIIRNFK